MTSPWVRAHLFVALLGAPVHAEKTEVDLSNSWTPFLFANMVDAEGQPAVSRYRAVFLGLANDTSDRDGQPLSPGEHNYLELFGIPPSLSVLRARFLQDANPS